MLLSDDHVRAAILSPDYDATYVASYVTPHLGRLVRSFHTVAPLLRPGLDVLDVGSHGLLAPAFVAAGVADITCFALERERSQPERTFALPARAGDMPVSFALDLGDVRAGLPYPDGRFDLVLFLEVLEHLDHGVGRAIAELARVLAPGGHLLLTTPSCASLASVASILAGGHPWVHGALPEDDRRTDELHHREYVPREVDALLAPHLELVDAFTADVYERTGGRLARAALAAALSALALVTGGRIVADDRGDTIFRLARKPFAGKAAGTAQATRSKRRRTAR